jgi:hypothetical protein
VTDSWSAALDRLEADLCAAEQLLERRDPAAIEPWTPPVLGTPLPVELRERARTLRERQDALAVAVAEASVRTKRQLAVTDQIGRATRRSTTRSVYIDTNA